MEVSMLVSKVLRLMEENNALQVRICAYEWMCVHSTGRGDKRKKTRGSGSRHPKEACHTGVKVFIFDPADDKLHTGTGGFRGRKVAHKSHARDAASAPAPQIRHTLAQVPEVRIRFFTP